MKKMWQTYKMWETWVTAVESETLTGTKHSYCHSYQKLCIKLHHLMFYYTSIIIGLHAHLLSLTQAPQKGFRVTSEGEALILNKNILKFVLTRNWWTLVANYF